MAKTGNTAGEYAAIWDGARWVSIRGDKGDPGQLVIKGSVASPADLPATGTPGDVYLVSGNLYSWDDTTSNWIDGGRIQGPQGPQGPSGTPGRDGIDGVSSTVRVGTVSEGPLSVTNTGTASQAVINFTIPKGDAGPAGPAGADGVAPTISIGTTSVLPSGSSATVTQTGTASNVVLSFGIPTGPAGSAGATGLKGDPGVAGPAGSVGPAGAAGPPGAAGADGKDGAAASLAIGTVTTLEAGKPATVSNSGTSSAAVINFGLPQGSQGLQGPAGADGAAATIAIGTVTSGTKAAVTNSGTSSAAIINFTLVPGATGPAGADGKDGAGVTIKGTLTGAATALPTAVAGDMYLLGDPVPTAAPSPSVGAKAAGDGIVYNGTTWSNVGPIRGPAGPAGVAGAKGDAGPTEVSADANNYSKLGTDNKLFTPTPDIPAAATALPLADGKAAVLGVSTKYAREDHVHILPTLIALGAADATHTHAASTDITGLSKVATSGKYTDLTDTPTAFTLPTATDKILGGIKVGTGLTITGDVLSASGTTSPDASTTVKGIVQLADAAAITAGTASRAVDAAHLKTALDLKAPLASPSFTGVVSLPLGAATAPSLAFTGDVDTGLFLKAANTPVIVAGGVESLVVTATGVSVPGNITSTGKAHTFEAGSIKRAAIEGIDETALDARYVNVDGDTMTGQLIVQPAVGPAIPDGSVQVIGDSTTANVSAAYHSDTNGCGQFVTKRSRGTLASPAPVAVGDFTAQITFRAKGADGKYVTAGNIFNVVTKDPAAGESGIFSRTVLHGTGGISIVSVDAARNVCYTGIGTTTPTHTLEVGGDTTLRGPLEVVGNITSSGTAHNFVAKSIPASAISGLTSGAIPKKTPASQTATGTEGDFCWDANYFYGAIAANQWRRIPWQQWGGVDAPWYPVAATGPIYGNVSSAHGLFFGTTAGLNGSWSADGSAWNTDDAAAVGGPWGRVVYGAGTFVRIMTGVNAQSALVATSLDGKVWTQRASIGAYGAGDKALAFGGGKFVALANANSGAATPKYSVDGINWVNGTYTGVAPTASKVSAAASNGTIFVAVYGSGTHTQAARSADGQAWAATTLPTSQAWNDVAFGGGKFVAVGTGLKAAYSADGTTWTAVDMPGSATWSAIAYGGGKFMAVASGSLSAATSPDGITWTAISLPSAKAWDGVASDGNVFVITSSNGAEQAITIPV